MSYISLYLANCWFQYQMAGTKFRRVRTHLAKGCTKQLLGAGNRTAPHLTSSNAAETVDVTNYRPGILSKQTEFDVNTVFRLFWHRTEIRLMSNQSEKCDKN